MHLRVVADANVQFLLLFEGRCESEQAFPNLRRRPGSKTEDKRWLELRLDTIK
jgi:hypothetical protein